MVKLIRSYFLHFSALEDSFGGFYPARKITAMGVFAGLIAAPIILFILIVGAPFIIATHYLNKL